MTATRSHRRLVPQLREIARFGLRQLDADALLVVDARNEPGLVLAREGQAAGELLADLELLPTSGAAVDATGIARGRLADRSVLSLAVTPDGEARPLAAVHVRLRAGDGSQPPSSPEQLLALAQQVGLVLARIDATGDAHRPGDGVDPLRRLDALPSLPDAVPRLTATVADALRPRLGVATACLVVWDGERSILRALPGSFGTSDQALSDSISGPRTNPFSLTARVFATGQPYIANRARFDPSLLQQYVDVFGLHRVMALPLTIGAETIGVLLLADKPAPFTIEDLVDLEALAPRIATAVELTLSIDKIRRGERMERVLADTATAVASGRPFGACLTSGLRALGEATAASLAVFSPPSGPPIIWRGRPVQRRLEDDFLRAAQDMAEPAAGAFPHDAGDPGWAAAHAPVMFTGARIAAVSLLRQNALPFGSDEEESLSRLADLAALAWASERYQRQLAELTASRERARIADELHDHVAQIMFAAQLGLDSLMEDAGATADDLRRLVEIQELLTKGERAVRTVIDGCTPAPHTDLVGRLRNTVDAVREQFHASVALELPPGVEVPDVSRRLADCAVRVAHEAIVNAAKHAGRCHIVAGLRVTEEQLCLVVDDDGVGPGGDGFHDGHGLASIRRAVSEVGGEVHVGAGPDGAGTRVRVALPRHA